MSKRGWQMKDESLVGLIPERQKMMDKQEKIIERYYRGESSIEEERRLRKTWREGLLPDDPILGVGDLKSELPIGLIENIQSSIRQKRKKHHHKIYMTVASIAALAILIIMLRVFLPHKSGEGLQLSDNLKIERFEEALRVIGNVLEEKTITNEKILYEDNSMIIVSE